MVLFAIKTADPSLGQVSSLDVQQFVSVKSYFLTLTKRISQNEIQYSKRIYAE